MLKCYDCRGRQGRPRNKTWLRAPYCGKGENVASLAHGIVAAKRAQTIHQRCDLCSKVRNLIVPHRRNTSMAARAIKAIASGEKRQLPTSTAIVIPATAIGCIIEGSRHVEGPALLD